MLPLSCHLLTIPPHPQPLSPSASLGERGDRVYCFSVAASSEDSRYFTNRSISAGFQQPHLNRFLPSRSISTGGHLYGARLGQFVYRSIFGRKYHPRQQRATDRPPLVKTISNSFPLPPQTCLGEREKECIVLPVAISMLQRRRPCVGFWWRSPAPRRVVDAATVGEDTTYSTSTWRLSWNRMGFWM